MPYLGASGDIPGANIKSYRYKQGADTSTGATSFPAVNKGADELRVYLNGTLLKLTADYTFTTSAVSITPAPADDDEIQIDVYTSINLADTVSSSDGGNFVSAVTFQAGVKTGTVKAQDGTSAITIADSTGKVTIPGDLEIQGTTTTIDTNVESVDKLEVGANSTDYAVKVNQTGTGNLLQLQDNGTDKFVVEDGGNVGIGQSPGKKLDIDGDVRIRGDAGTLNFYRTTSPTDVASIEYNHSDTALKVWAKNKNINFSSADADQDTPHLFVKGTTGEVGIGVSPNYTGLQIHGTTNQFGITNSTTGSGLDKGFGIAMVGVNAQLINKEGGYLALHTSDEEKVRIDSDGKFGIGQTVPGAPLHVSVPHARTDTSERDALFISSNETDGTYSGLEVRLKGGASDSARSVFLQTATQGSSDDGILGLQSWGGKVAIGLTDPGQNNLAIKSDSHAYLYLDSSATSKASWLYLNQGNTTSRGWLLGMESNYGHLYVYDLSDSSYATEMQAGGNGWVANSDERIKKDIVSMENRLDDLLNIQVRRFRMKKSNREREGFIAQELVNHAPEAVKVGSDELASSEEAEESMTLNEGDLKNPWGVSREALIPMMIKSIQELSAKVTALETA